MIAPLFELGLILDSIEALDGSPKLAKFLTAAREKLVEANGWLAKIDAREHQLSSDLEKYYQIADIVKSAQPLQQVKG
ncbi:MAG: hypothetical protein FWG15_08680 [Propionibacteriaceae bacterium]|nr:hypothetical protein [Propionibacteriaceae bacterium]